MIITNTIESNLRERLSKTEGGIKAAAALGGITERAAHKILKKNNVRQETYEAFCKGLTQLELEEANQLLLNEQMSAGSALQVA